MTYTITTNETYKSLEISFDEKPSKAIISALKGLHFRWNPKRSIWYGFTTQDKLENVLNGKQEEYSHGVKVGDLFYMSWGYDQTNVNFFQVVKISDKCAWIKEVTLPVVNEDYISSMSRDVTFSTKNAQVRDRSVFIKDQINGDRHVIRMTNYFGKEEPQITLKSGYYYITPYKGEEVYESWYA